MGIRWSWRRWWNRPKGWPPGPYTYTKRSVRALLLGFAAIAVAWYVFDASAHVLWAIALVAVWGWAHYGGNAEIQGEWYEAERLRFEQEHPDYRDLTQLAVGEGDDEWIAWAKAEIQSHLSNLSASEIRERAKREERFNLRNYVLRRTAMRRGSWSAQREASRRLKELDAKEARENDDGL